MPAPAEVDQKSYDFINISHRYISTPQWNFGVNAEARLLTDIFNGSLTADMEWQSDTYHSAKRYAYASGATRIIDIGCGSARKLKSLFGESDFELITVDFAKSSITSQKNYSAASDVECDLTSWNEVLAVAERYRDDVPTVILCADVIEHLSDPRPLLAFIRLLLAESANNRCFLSTPDRSKLEYRRPTSKPANPARIREWTTGELRDLLTASGFYVAQVENIRANVHDVQASTILAECSFDASLYREALARNGIASENVSSVMITTEYPGLIASGGIGTFVADWHRSNDGSVVLTTFDFDKKKKSEIDLVFSPSDVIDVSRIDDIGTADVLLQAVTQLLFMCPDLKEIHFQEYLGIGMRIAQAKKAGILPDTLTIVTHCHGNQHYLENANQAWSGVDAQAYAVKEKVCIELSDQVVFPSFFLGDLYSRAGIFIEDNKALMCPYRYANINADNLKFSNIRRIVFIGKFMSMKGFDLFCESFDKSFCKVLKAKGIEEVTLIGRGPNGGYVNEAAIKRYFKLTVHTDFDLTKLVSYIRENRSDSVFVEPYRGDNFPLAVYDVVGNGGLLLAGNAGGIPEMFQTEVWQECLVDLTIESLRYKIHELVDWDNGRKSRVAAELIDDLRRNNDKVGTIKYAKADKSEVEFLSSTVMIPFYNTEITEFIDLLKSLNQQSLHPTEIIIVNDASEYRSRIEMAEAAQKHLNIPFRIIDHPYNRGLAGARNTALDACKTDLILNADSDDIPLNDWVKTIVIAMTRDPLAAAAVPYLAAFDAGTDFNEYLPKGQYIYRPLGDGFVTSQIQNDLGHANSGYRVSHAKRLGGWNATSKAKYEDWAFYLNVIANDLRIAIIPKVTCLYRVRKNSMARTYSEWPGQLRLYQTTNGLSRFESLQLQRLCRMASSADGIIELQRRLSALENRKVLRITNAITARLRRIPLLYLLLSKATRLSWKVAGRIRRSFSS
ncbi:glycosyltransferase [Brucella pseudogrignonensis]|uniref:glycosyltransferase n=1 Tax=Brucella pseudogrignonensis TaxID=419475 RepID=UPI00124CE266|nr:glycosyltransferase [Brucella pseudogrignonensis]KAB2685061.1 glycosyltransferase [Brucella pseudogrignonensis]